MLRKESYLSMVALPTFNSLEGFIKSNETQALVDLKGDTTSLTYATKLQTTYQNIDYMIYAVEKQSTGRRIYFVKDNIGYPIDTFNRKVDYGSKMTGLLDLIEKEFRAIIASNNIEYLKALNVDISEEAKKKNRVKSDLDLNTEDISFRVSDFIEGLLFDLAIPYGILEENFNLEEIAKKIASNPESIKLIYSEKDEDTPFYYGAMEIASVLARKSYLWEGEYTEDMIEMKERLEEKIREDIIKRNKHIYGTFEEFINKKVKLKTNDKLTRTGVVKSINFSLKTPFLVLNNIKGSQEYNLDNIKSLELL